MLSRRPGRALGVALLYRDLMRTITEPLERAEYRRSPSLLGHVLGQAWRRGGPLVIGAG